MKSGIKQIATVSIIILCMLVAMFFLMYQEYEYTYTRADRMIETTRVAETELNKSLYKALKRETQAKTDKVAKDIREDLINNYDNDMEQFANDYDNPIDSSILIKTIDSEINKDDDRYFHIESDSNDMFAMSKSGVISSKSESRTIYGATKSEDKTINDRSNQPLAEQTLESILNGDNNHMFWRYRNTIGNKNGKIGAMDIDKVLQMPYRDLKDYEFLTVSYIDKHGDIMGTTDASRLGKDNNSKKIMIVQGFNLYEHIDQEFKSSYTRLAKNEKLQLAIIEESRREITLKLFFMIALVLVSFVSISLLQNVFIKGCGVNDKSK